MPCKKAGKRDSDTEWRICYSDNALPSIPLLHKDHGTRRQKKLLAHVVRLRILACRNDLNRKRIFSLQLTAHS